MKKYIVFLIFLSEITLTTYGQNCDAYFPVKQGAVVTTQNFNAKNTLLSTNKLTVLSVNSDVKGMVINVKNEFTDAKTKEVSSIEYALRCSDNIFYVDMKNLLDPKSQSNLGNAQVKISGTDIEYPSQLQVGQILKDAEIKVDYSSTNDPMSFAMSAMNINIKIFNRKVEAIENITTPAGTFECYKISYTFETKSFVNIKGNNIEWVAKNIGTVKSESYDSKGKLISYSIISDINN